MPPKNNSPEYWRNRMLLLEKAQKKRTERFIKDLERQYDYAARTIEDQILVWYARFAQNNQIDMATARQWLNTKELAEFKWDVKQYIKYGQENALDQRWMKELENASARVHISRLEALKLQMQQQVEALYGNQLDGVDKHLRRVYSDEYFHTAYEIQRGFNLGWDLHDIDSNRLTKILSRPWAADGKTFSSRIWGNKQQLYNTLQTQLSQAVITGKSPADAIQVLVDQFGVDKRKAGRLIMTETAAFASAAQKDCYNDLDVERFEIVATLDTHTSEICQDLDGQIFNMRDYEVGVTAPPFHPWCRTVTVPYFDDNYGERAARGADGETYYVPSDMKYADWKKAFVSGGSKAGITPTNISLTDQINQIKANIAAKGGNIEETDIQEAGRAIKTKLESNPTRLQFKNQLAALEQQYEATGINKLRDEYARLQDVVLGLGTPQSVGFNSVDDIRKKIKEIMAQINQLRPIVQPLQAQIFDMRQKFVGIPTENAAELKDLLSQLRGMGNDNLNIDAHLNNSRSPMRKIVKSAYDVFPTDWVHKSVLYGNLTPKKVKRGYYGYGEIAISGFNDDSCFETAIHELGHRFERVIPGILNAERAFYNRRTAGEPLQWLGKGYDRDEKSRFDKFLNKYIGKDYGGTAYELASMGFEYAYINPTKLWEDEDFATWIYGILALF